MARIHFAGCIGDLATAGKCEFTTQTGSPANASAPVAGSGMYAMRVTSLVSATKKGVGFRYLSTVVDGQTYFFAFDVYIPTRPSAANQIVSIQTSSISNPVASAPGVRIKSTGELEFILGIGTVKSTSPVLSLNTRYRVEFSWKRDASTPSAGADVIAFKVSQATDGDIHSYTSSAETLSPGASVMRDFVAGGNLNSEAQTQGDWYIWNIRVNDSTGAVQNSWPGPGNITYMRPAGTGTFDEPTATGAATNWEATDDTSPDGTTTYANMSAISASWAASGSRLLMTTETPTAAGIGASDTVTLLGIGVVWSSATASTSAVCPGLKISGGSAVDCGVSRTISSSSDQFIDDAVGTAIYAAQYTDPNAAAWTPSTLGSGFEIGARADDTSPNARLTAVWAAVEFIPNTVPTIDKWIGHYPADVPARTEVVGY